MNNRSLHKFMYNDIESLKIQGTKKQNHLIN